MIKNAVRTLPIPRRKESDLKCAIAAYLRTRPDVVIGANVRGAARSTYKGKRRYVPYGLRITGASDFIGWKRDTYWHVQIGKYFRPRFLAIETKAKGKKPTAEQQWFLDMVRADGGIGILAYSVEDGRRGLDDGR